MQTPLEDTSIPAILQRPSHKLDADIPVIPERPSKRPERPYPESEPTQDIPPIPQRPPKREPQQTPVQDLGDDYMIDGIEKRVPLLPETTDTQDLTLSLQELVTNHPEEHEASDELPVIPQRPIRRSTLEETDIPVIPERPVRKTSMESPVDEPTIPRRPSQRSRVSAEDDKPPAIPHRPAGRPASIKSTKSQDLEDLVEHPKLSTAKSVGEESTEPIIPPRPILKSPEEEPVIPPRPTRKSSVKSIPESVEESPSVPPRPTRTASIREYPRTPRGRASRSFSTIADI